VAILREYRGLKPRIGNNVYLADDVVLVGDVTLEDDVSIWWGSVLRGDCGAIHVGRGSNIQEACLLHATTDYSTTHVGVDVTVGHHAIIHGARVEEGALIGMKSTILDRAVIGRHSIVGAAALVTESTEIPPDSLAVGVPARVKRTLDDENRRQSRQRAEEYRELAAFYLSLREVEAR
jgi:carbonic anhydrase/acetyltransferase-like protein (isoleucine patch superfamily)